MTTFTASAIIPAFEGIAEEFGVTLHKAAYLTSLQIAILGWAPLFWKPIANRYGRRPVWLISTLGSLVFNMDVPRATHTRPWQSAEHSLRSSSLLLVAPDLV